MATYSIKELGIISGVKPHTIRIWEQRYGLLKPMRSETNIRYYDDEQFKKLLNVKELINAGMKISHIADLSPKQISIELDKIIADAYENERGFESIISQIIISIATFDEALFEQIFSNCVIKFRLNKTYLNVIYPTLVRVGLMWCKNDIMPAQEHFFSNLIKKKLFSTIDSLSIPKNANQTWVLFLNEEEEHEIGLLFAYYLIRKHGKKVIYLGGKVPYDNLSRVVKQCEGTHLYTFFVKNHYDNQINDLITKLNGDFKKSTICFSGKKEIIANIPLNKNRVWIKELQSLIEMIE
ncbi:MAG: MerR family transcriptional regulator [Bacteroidia bacterium]|nr:MerR family transcriptional regulator [Bacteroidia bacterium]